MVSGWLFLVVSSLCSFPCVSPSPCSSLPTSTCTLTRTPSSMWTTSRQTTPAPPPTEESCPLAGYTPPAKRIGFFEEDRSPSYLRRFSSNWRSWYSIGLCWLFSVTLHDDNTQEFDTRGDEVLLSRSKIPSDDILESLYKFGIRESAQLKTVFELYDMEIHQKISVPNYQKLETMDKRTINLKLRLRNFDARHGRIELDARHEEEEQCSKIVREWVALKEEEIFVTSGKKKASVRKGDRCSFRHESNDRSQKPEHIAATPSEASMSRGRSVSKKRSIQRKSNHGAILGQPCRYYLKSTCTRTSC